MIFLLRKLAAGLLVSSFFTMMSVQAAIVEPVYKQLKDPNLDGVNNVPSTVSLSITPNGKKMFVLDHLGNAGTKKVHIYDLTTPFDLSTMDVSNRSIVSLQDYGDNLLGNNDNKDIEFNNDGTKVFFFLMNMVNCKFII